ncbi:hypothetical protein IMG5_056360 [Ichthyophthirius multifiliis]|uniref:Dynein light chain n=1 Tax=Ichthyophthirius multifiliis TaxID=5932 RepID=G0QN92_ICHMU|nr:hypothetical protein IMG5_056360 [Ichthyophthirius multifiliis]EGR33313.1 hypothetical protein IMG5_056360 [Ichthyophthirius multifiliis]|eukprot:XP_004037299.1 hypothetical protein IMG5_056360 [Ichthyophthirius multifiliis]
MSDENQDEQQFQPEEAEKQIVLYIEKVLQGKPYKEDMVPHQINEICEQTLEYLIKQQKPYKYIVNCMIMQSTGSGACATQSCYWDSVTDHIVTVKWPKENKEYAKNQLSAVVTVFATCLITNH